MLLVAQEQPEGRAFVVGRHWSSQGDSKNAGPGKDSLKLHLNFPVSIFHSFSMVVSWDAAVEGES